MNNEQSGRTIGLLAQANGGQEFKEPLPVHYKLDKSLMLCLFKKHASVYQQIEDRGRSFKIKSDS